MKFDPTESPGDQYPGTDQFETGEDEPVERPDRTDDPDKEPVEEESDRELQLLYSYCNN